MSTLPDQPARRPRWGTLALVIVFHLVVFAGLTRAFAPDLTADPAQDTAATMVTITTHEQPPPPTASPTPDAGAAAPQAATATARAVSAPTTPLAANPVETAPVASTGTQDRSGASAAGEGSGGGGEGAGTGSGNQGSGQGNGAATKAVLVSGALSAVKDFPIPPGGRAARIGRSVIVALTVGTDGVPSDCRIYRSSGLPDTDRRTCELALQRLRFRPAADARGEPVVSTFYWQQRFFE